MYNAIDREEAITDNSLNLVVAGDGKVFTNIDANANEVPEEKILEAMKLSLDEMKPWLDAQNEFAKC